MFPRALFKASILIVSAAGFACDLRASAPDAERLARGEKIFAEKCALCHQATGQGAPPVYPPLAGSDFLLKDRDRSIRIICEGLSDPITVNGQAYVNVMPAQILDDAQAADVLTFVTNAWGNEAPAYTPAEVAKARKKSRFPTFAALMKSTAYRPLPPAPKGWALREVAALPEFCVRLAGNGKGDVYVLAQNGGIYSLDQKAGAVAPIVKPADYLDPSRGDLVALGLTESADGRLWFVINQKVTVEGEKYVQNEVSVYRTSETVDGHPAAPKLWFRTHYPYGVGSYNHGVSTMAFGPDGMLYVNSGSRTDGGETGKDPHYYPGGEVDLTSCIWRLDPKAEEPKVEVFARGIRNAFGFAWDASGNLFTASNGPDYNAPEEMDCVKQGKHYGFPYQFSNWPVKPHFPYKYTPSAPKGLDFTLPVANLGPAAGGSPKKPMYTFDPHSSPAGMLWCGDDFTQPLGGGFLITRFGNLLGPPAAPRDVGFDVLSCKLTQLPHSDSWQARTTTVLAPLGRPIDMVRDGPGRVLILEYTRPTNFREKLGWMPGRIVELAPEVK